MFAAALLGEPPPPDPVRRDKLVGAWYRRIFRRQAGEVELPHWRTLPEEKAVAQALVLSYEAQALLYRAVSPAYFGKPRPEGEKAWLAGAVGRRRLRDDLRRHLAGSDDFWTGCGRSRRTAIERLHTAILGRAPRGDEVPCWELALEQGLALTKLADLLADSLEGRVVRARAIHAEIYGVPPPADAEAWLVHALATQSDEDVLAFLYANEPFLGKALNAR